MLEPFFAIQHPGIELLCMLPRNIVILTADLVLYIS